MVGNAQTTGAVSTQMLEVRHLASARFVSTNFFSTLFASVIRRRTALFIAQAQSFFYVYLAIVENTARCSNGFVSHTTSDRFAWYIIT
jgi:hypothetical protein